jgi:hypothetical protein
MGPGLVATAPGPADKVPGQVVMGPGLVLTQTHLSSPISSLGMGQMLQFLMRRFHISCKTPKSLHNKASKDPKLEKFGVFFQFLSINKTS